MRVALNGLTQVVGSMAPRRDEGGEAAAAALVLLAPNTHTYTYTPLLHYIN